MNVLFVHGALVRDGQWWWHRMVEPLTRRGLSTGVVVLPSCEGAPGELGDMYADAAAVSDAVAAAGGPVILLRELFFADCDEDTFTEALTRAAPQSQVAFGQPVRRVAWREVRSTYVVCTEDHAIPAAGQRAHAAKATRTVELACGHHPFLSQPEALARIIADSASTPR